MLNFKSQAIQAPSRAFKKARPNRLYCIESVYEFA